MANQIAGGARPPVPPWEIRPCVPAQFTYNVGGSFFRDAAGNHAGYAIIQLHPDDTFTQVQTMKCAQPCSAQLSEIKALTAACRQGKL